VSGSISGCQAAINAVDRILNSSAGYMLNPDWKKNFSADNHTSPENIFVAVHVAEGELGGNFPFRTLHYNQLNSGWGSPWNGFATLAETYNAFDANDARRNMWLVGQAYSFETGLPVNDRTGAPLVFTVDIPDAEKAGEGTGVRFNKFPPIPSAVTGNAQPNDYPFFRLAEMYLIKAEALNELGQLGPALVEINRVRSRVSPNPVVAGTQQELRDAILKERLLELAAEGKRRTDLVRHGKFLNQWSTAMANGKQDRRSEPHRILMPIPATQISANPLLTQNPGY